ncbi:hypothetical protein CPB84DRAFT_1965953 [Gymnopilus junonius]|uniref:Uncharacterized protein n=1 Tax=Gymnopilus junonius TaxID=109634 RepID=A0A9P5NE66_GYMJU|nr:hypothetical protein CPB84DRAFT_1965953 [Gymnopilus junonius]
MWMVLFHLSSYSCIPHPGTFASAHSSLLSTRSRSDDTSFSVRYCLRKSFSVVFCSKLHSIPLSSLPRSLSEVLLLRTEPLSRWILNFESGFGDMEVYSLGLKEHQHVLHLPHFKGSSGLFMVVHWTFSIGLRFDMLYVMKILSSRRLWMRTLCGIWWG